MTSRFPAKLPQEARVLGFNFNYELEPGEQLTSAGQVNITVLYGSDANPNDLINGSLQLFSTTLDDGTPFRGVLIPVVGGIDLNDYMVLVSEVATNNPDKVLAWPAILPVRQYPKTAEI